MKARNFGEERETQSVRHCTDLQWPLGGAALRSERSSILEQLFIVEEATLGAGTRFGRGMPESAERLGSRIEGTDGRVGTDPQIVTHHTLTPKSAPKSQGVIWGNLRA